MRIVEGSPRNMNEGHDDQYVICIEFTFKSNHCTRSDLSANMKRNAVKTKDVKSSHVHRLDQSRSAVLQLFLQPPQLLPSADVTIMPPPSFSMLTLNYVFIQIEQKKKKSRQIKKMLNSCACKCTQKVPVFFSKVLAKVLEY